MPWPKSLRPHPNRQNANFSKIRGNFRFRNFDPQKWSELTSQKCNGRLWPRSNNLAWLRLTSEKRCEGPFFADTLVKNVGGRSLLGNFLSPTCFWNVFYRRFACLRMNLSDEILFQSQDLFIKLPNVSRNMFSSCFETSVTVEELMNTNLRAIFSSFQAVFPSFFFLWKWSRPISVLEMQRTDQ